MIRFRPSFRSGDLWINSCRLTGLVLVGLMAVACTGAASAPIDDKGDRLSGDQDTDPGIAQPAEEEPATEDETLADGALIVRSGVLHLEVGELAPALDQAALLISGLGGYVSGSNETNTSSEQIASITYRIPSARWDEALRGLRGLGKRVISENTTAADVTAEVVDLDARLGNLRASESALQQIMTGAGTIDDVLKVQRELTSVRSEIESMTARRDQLSQRAALATLEVGFEVPVVALSQASEGWNLGVEVDHALASLVTIGQRVASFGVWALIVVLPVVLPVGLLAYVGLRIRRRWLSQRPPASPVARSM